VLVAPRVGRAVYRGCVSRERIEPAPRFIVAGEPCASETLHCYAGARVLELATALPDLGVRVETVYVTAKGAKTQVTDLFLAAGEEILATRQLTDHPISGARGRLRCLRDHAERVEAFLLSLGHYGVTCQLSERSPTPRP
jgi:hypothetical protein